VQPNGEVPGVIQGLRLNIRDLHAGGENQARRLKHPVVPPRPDNICRGRGIREPSSSTGSAGNSAIAKLTRGIPRPRALHLLRRPPASRSL